MNSEEQSQDFEKLQRLLKLKRYEQPPPRYFNDFSTRVISHIRADTSVKRFESTSDFISRTPWLRRLRRKLESQPALSGVIATVACGLMVAGVFLMEETKPPTTSFMPAGEGNAAGNNLATAPGLGNNFAAGVATPQFVSSTNISPFPTGPNLFENLPTLQAVPVSGKPHLQR